MKRKTNVLWIVLCFGVALVLVSVMGPSLFHIHKSRTALAQVGQYHPPTPTVRSFSPHTQNNKKTSVGKTTELVLMYHYIRAASPSQSDKMGYQLSTDPHRLESQIIALKQSGYRSLTMAQLISKPNQDKVVALTFDDGYEDFYTNAYPILKKYGWTATVYVISAKLGGAYLTADQLKELSDAGIEIGSHTVHHLNLAHSSIAIQEKEIRESKQTLESIIGKPVVSFCYPSGGFTQETETLVKNAGYTSATTTKEGAFAPTDNLFEIPRVRMSPSMTDLRFTGLLKNLH
jgi:peptidoglycan/xylan/chitin deacetylase (PgdA/CDA1 family)